MKKILGFFFAVILTSISLPAYAEVTVDTGKYAYIRLSKEDFNCYLGRKEQEKSGAALASLVSEWLKSKQWGGYDQVVTIDAVVPHIAAVCDNASMGVPTSITVGVHVFYHPNYKVKGAN